MKLTILRLRFGIAIAVFTISAAQVMAHGRHHHFHRSDIYKKSLQFLADNGLAVENSSMLKPFLILPDGTRYDLNSPFWLALDHLTRQSLNSPLVHDICPDCVLEDKAAFDIHGLMKSSQRAVLKGSGRAKMFVRRYGAVTASLYLMSEALIHSALPVLPPGTECALVLAFFSNYARSARFVARNALSRSSDDPMLCRLRAGFTNPVWERKLKRSRGHLYFQNSNAKIDRRSYQNRLLNRQNAVEAELAEGALWGVGFLNFHVPKNGRVPSRTPDEVRNSPNLSRSQAPQAIEKAVSLLLEQKISIYTRLAALQDQAAFFEFFISGMERWADEHMIAQASLYLAYQRALSELRLALDDFDEISRAAILQTRPLSMPERRIDELSSFLTTSVELTRSLARIAVVNSASAATPDLRSQTRAILVQLTELRQKIRSYRRGEFAAPSNIPSHAPLCSEVFDSE